MCDLTREGEQLAVDPGSPAAVDLSVVFAAIFAALPTAGHWPVVRFPDQARELTFAVSATLALDKQLDRFAPATEPVATTA